MRHSHSWLQGPELQNEHRNAGQRRGKFSRKIDGALSAAGLRFGIVVSRFNSFITERLLQGALDALERGGAAGKDVDVVHVPGSFELPLAAKKLAATGRTMR